MLRGWRGKQPAHELTWTTACRECHIDAMAEFEGDWYAVRCVFATDHNQSFGPTDLDQDESTYEERITLWLAPSAETAIEHAEVEAHEYAEAVGSRYVGLAQSYWLADRVGHGAEVFSLIRKSKLSPTDYLDRFFDTGDEYQRPWPAEPSTEGN